MHHAPRTIVRRRPAAGQRNGAKQRPGYHQPPPPVPEKKRFRYFEFIDVLELLICKFMTASPLKLISTIAARKNLPLFSEFVQVLENIN
jgi:hypothetical protein